MLWAYRKSSLVLLVAIGMIPLWLLIGAQRFRLLIDQRQVLSPEASSRHQWEEFVDEFHYRDDFTVLAQDSGFDDSSRSALPGKGSESLKAMQALGRAVLADPQFESVFYQVQAPVLAQSALYFLRPTDLQKIESSLVNARPWLKEAAAPDGLQRLLDYLSGQSPQELVGQLRPVLGLLETMVRALAKTIATTGEATYVSPFPAVQPDVEWLKNQPVYRGQSSIPYALADGKTYVLLARPELGLSSFQSGDYLTSLRAVRVLRAYIDRTQLYYRNVNFYLTGERELQTAEVYEVLLDIARCGSAGALLLAAALLARLRSTRILGCIVLSNAIAVGWLIGFDSLLGPLNILTLQHWFFAALASLWWTMLALIRFLVNLQSNADPEQAWAATAAVRNRFRWFIVVALLFWSCLAALGGGSLRMLSSYCCAGFIVVMLELTFLFPAVVALLFGRGCSTPFIRAAWLHLPLRGARSLIRLAQQPLCSRLLILVFLASLAGLPRISWDSDLLNLPARALAARQVEQVLEPLGYSTLYALSVAGDLDEAEKLRRRFLALPTVARAESITMLIPDSMGAKQTAVTAIVEAARKLPMPAQQATTGLVARPKGEPLRADELLKLYARYQTAYRKVMAALLEMSEPGEVAGPPLRGAARALSAAMTELKGKLDLDNPGPVRDGLVAYQRSLLQDFSGLLQFLDDQRTAVPDLLAQLPASLKRRTVSSRGRIAIRVYPRFDSWRSEPLARFVNDLRSVDPNVTGTPPLLLDFLHGIRNGLARGLILFAGAGALVAVWWRYRRRLSPSSASDCEWGPARLAFPLLGALWSLGLAGLLGMQLNALNVWFWVLSLHLGWLYGLAASGSDPECCDEPFVLALVALGMAGFFLMASHLGVRSCARMMTLGTLCQILTSLAWPQHYWGQIRSRTGDPGSALESRARSKA